MDELMEYLAALGAITALESEEEKVAALDALNDRMLAKARAEEAAAKAAAKAWKEGAADRRIARQEAKREAHRLALENRPRVSLSREEMMYL